VLTTVAITLPFPAPPGLADELSEDLGVYPHIDENTRGVDPATVGIVVATAMGVFVGGMIEEFGAQAAERLMRALGRLQRSSNRTDPADLRLVDEENDVVIVVSPQAIADVHAMAALVAQERDVFQPGVELHWNLDSGRWHAQRPDRAEHVELHNRSTTINPAGQRDHPR
jgi:hypothetical protein